MLQKNTWFKVQARPYMIVSVLVSATLSNVRYDKKKRRQQSRFVLERDTHKKSSN